MSSVYYYIWYIRGQYTITLGMFMRLVYYDTRCVYITTLGTYILYIYIYELSILQCVDHMREGQSSSVALIQHINISFTTPTRQHTSITKLAHIPLIIHL